MPSVSDLKIYGDEPMWDRSFSDDVDRRCAIGKAFNWYNYMSDNKDHKKWLVDYLKKNNYDDAIIENVSRVAAEDIDMNPGDIANCLGVRTGVVARLAILEAPLDTQDVQKLHTAIDILNKRGAHVQAPAVARPTVQKYVDDSFSKILEFLNQRCDSILIPKKLAAGSTQVSLDASIRSIAAGKKSAVQVDEIKNYIDSIKPMYCKKIIDYYTPIRDEICQVIGGKDPVLQEGYSTYSRVTLDNYNKLMTKIIDDCKSKIDTAPRPIVVRRKRRRPAIEVVKKLKYKKDDAAAGLISIMPSKIVDAQKLVVYNSKYRTVTLYEAAGSQGLSVKGTTIINYDENKSRTKKLRKPKEFFAKLNNKGIRAFKSAFDAVKCVEKPAKGRINQDTILYGVYE